MPLPNSPIFDSFLRSLQCDNPADSSDWTRLYAVPESIVYDDGRMEKRPSVSIWDRQTSELSIDAFLKKLEAELRRVDHPATKELATAILAMSVLARRESVNVVEQFNGLFEQIVAADLNQYFLFTLPSPPEFNFEIGPFRVGPLRADRLRYQSERAGSDFFERYCGRLFRNALSVEREPLPTRIIHFHELVTAGGAWAPPSSEAAERTSLLADHYFQLLSQFHSDLFFRDLISVQEVPIAIGSGWFDPQRLRETLGSQFITVYLNIDGLNRGHVHPGLLIPTIDLGGAHIGLPAATQQLGKEFGFHAPSNSEIHQSLRSFCHFVRLAESNHAEGRHAEGFLHHIIALDLLLGDKKNATETVAKRSAALTFRYRALSFDEAFREAQATYDARSKYVHQGIEPPEELWAVARSVCREITFCLLRLQRSDLNHACGFRDRWLKDIDIVTALLVANREPHPSDFERAGCL